MHWLEALDFGLFRFINQTLSNPVFDALMPFATGDKLFLPFVIAAGLWFAWKGGRRARLCVLMLALVVPLGDGMVCINLKKAVARPRPFVTHEDVRVYGGKNKNYVNPAAAPGRGTAGKSAGDSMPSAHAMNSFCVAMIFALYYRRSWRFTLPAVCLVAFSRVYNGMHYPSDVLAGAILGAGYAVAGMWALNSLWRWAGRRWFPLWWEKLPSLVEIAPNIQHSTFNNHQSSLRFASARHPMPPGEGGNPRPLGAAKRSEDGSTDAHWLRLGWLLIAAILVWRLAYLAGGSILLSEDEAYQWLWSKHLALSYYSKPPGIALAQWTGTAIWGDTAFGIRFLSPVLSAILGVLLLRFVARHTDGRAAVLFVLVCLATPLLAVGGVLMTVDPLAVFFWTLALLAAWRAIQRDSTAWWVAAGLGMGGAFLSKYISPLQWAAFALFFALCKPARAQLRRPGPWLALGINLLCALPVIIWNHQHGWITLTHLGERGGLDKPAPFTLKYLGEFAGGEFGVLNCVFFIAVIWAIAAFIRDDLKHRQEAAPRRSVELFLLCQGIVVFGFYALHSLRSRVQLNWIAAGVIPLLLFATLWWHRRWLAGDRKPARFVALGLALGLPVVILFHYTQYVRRPLEWIGSFSPGLSPAKMDPLNRVRGHDQMARIVGQQRAELLKEGRPVFIIADHYGRAGLLSFYLPEARPLVQGEALVTMHKEEKPGNQLWFWPGYGYENRSGQNALYVLKTDTPRPAREWLLADFESVTDLGLFDITHKGRKCNRIQLFACRGKR